MSAKQHHGKSCLYVCRTKPGEFVLQLMGLPMDSTPRTISEFLYPTKINEKEVTIVKAADGSGRCSGNGFAKVITSSYLILHLLSHTKVYVHLLLHVF